MEEKKGFFARLSAGLTKTRESISEKIGDVFSSFKRISDAFYDELEEALITADMGMNTTLEIMNRLRAEVKAQKVTETEIARGMLKGIIADIMRSDTPFLLENEKTVLLIVGVNGVGKTTTIGKIASIYKNMGLKVLLAAADTFRAAAAEQLVVWGERADVTVIKHGEGADPAAVVFDAIASAKAKNVDLLIVDTAGRLHNKKNLMEELKKIGRVIARDFPEAKKEVLLVLDATTGQNAVAQAKVFTETVELTGVILTKLDGTAKGGVVVAIMREVGIPVRFVGVGEGIEDLQVFDPEAFAEAIL